MSFSAISPEGPVTLIGVTPESVEAMRARNRKEKLYTAKCCGAPLSIRIAEGKAPHFVHQSTPKTCDAPRHETPEHRRLKYLIAEAAARTYEFDVETEARKVDPETGVKLWQADVLVSMRTMDVAIEVQLSNADYEHMRERQLRYQQSGVRGLWLVKTKKGFPQSKETPIFTLDNGNCGDWVDISTRWDLPDIWHRTEEANQIALPDFIEAVLHKRLRWAPFLNKPDTLLDADIGLDAVGRCIGCKRTAVTVDSSRLCIASEFGYPDYLWLEGLGHMKRTRWHPSIVNAVWNQAASSTDFTFCNSVKTCFRCKGSIEYAGHTSRKQLTLSAQIRLDALPKPTFGTVEWDWLRRWYVLQD